MKLACASSAFDRRLENGDLTQLEWLELCARELCADGIVCDVRHFPRRDSDYLAQVKKMAADIGMTVAALSDEAFFGGGERAMRETIDVALALGAPIVSASLQTETTMSWSAQLEALSVATALAKAANITLGVRNRANTFASGSHDLKRVSKEADSAWLRYALELETLDATSEPLPLAAKTVLLWHTHRANALERESSLNVSSILEWAITFRGFLVVDFADGAAERESMRNALRTWRTLLAEEELGAAIGG
ncbi:MAG: hypothetical protein NVS1B14_01960 [Vulcanimicrobiaceae bacterium]